MNATEIKEYRKRHNLTQNELAQITKSSLRAVQYWEKGEHRMPISALEWLNMYDHSHNGTTHNTQKNNGGDNIYINNNGGNISNSGNTTAKDKESAGQGYEIKEMTKLLNQLHETKIIEIDRLTKLYNGIIANQNEFIDTLKEQNSQYRKEIESLRQRINGNNENNDK